MPGTLEVRPGDVTPSDIESAWKELLAEARTPGSDVEAFLEDHQVDPQQFGSASLDVEEAEGNAGLTILIEIGAPVAVHILASLYDDFVRPYIRAKFKRDAGSRVD